MCSLHWTYDEIPAPGTDLQTGDVLLPSPEMKKILKEVHPYFADDKYIGFLVVTQSCDLVRRDGRPCSAKYINLCAIRLLETVLLQLLDHACDHLRSGVYYDDQRSRADNLVNRIVNQNEQALGLFYLHPQTELGIDEPAVAMLRVAVALRSEHYGVLCLSRRGTVKSEFRHKLGWLVGNMYSRVGTEDWTEPAERKHVCAKLVRDMLAPIDSSFSPIWISRDAQKTAQRNGVDLSTLPPDKLEETAKSFKPTPKFEEAAHRAAEVLGTLLAEQQVLAANAIVDALKKNLRADPIFKSYFGKK